MGSHYNLKNELEELVYFVNYYNRGNGDKRVDLGMKKNEIEQENYEIASFLQRQRISGTKIPESDFRKRNEYIKKVYKKEFFKLWQKELSTGKDIHITERKLDRIWNKSLDKYKRNKSLILVGKVLAIATAISTAIGGIANHKSSLPKSNPAIEQESTSPDEQGKIDDEENRLTYTGNLENENNSFFDWTKKDETLPGREFKDQIVEEYNKLNKTNIKIENILEISNYDVNAWINEQKDGINFNMPTGDEKHAILASYNCLVDEESKNIIAIYGTTDSNEISKIGNYCSFYINNLIIKKSEDNSIVYSGTNAIDLYKYALDNTKNKTDTLHLLNNYKKYFKLIREDEVKISNKKAIEEMEKQKAENKVQDDGTKYNEIEDEYEK